MRTPTSAAALFAAAAFASALLTWAWIALARRRQLQDLPGPRRLHAAPTPRGGGIAVALAMLGALAWIGIWAPPPEPWLPGLAAGIAAFAAVGLLDDLLPMPALLKLALQLVAAGTMLATAADGQPVGWLHGFALLFACAYFVNVWNFMDGSNGLVSLQAVLIALALAAWPGQGAGLRLASLALAAACLGFLPFNFPRARVFLGDVGSHAMGAAVFGLLWLSWRAGMVSLPQVLLLLSVVLLDSGLTLARRFLSGRTVWRAHREHLYQYAVRRGHSHARVALAYAAATALAWLLAVAVGGNHSSIVMVVVLTVGWLLGSAVYFGLRRRWLRKPMRKRSQE